MRTLFRDLSQHDVQDQIFLVCRIVKNGSMRMAPSGSSTSLGGHLVVPPADSRSETASILSSASQADAIFGAASSSGMLSSDRSGRQSYRRPFGCAVLEISQFNKVSADPSGATATVSEHHMPIFVPTSEASFSTLHESIVSSIIKDIERSPRAEHIAVNVRILYGDAAVLVKEHPSLLADIPLTNRLGFPDVVWPAQKRNEVYLKLWSGEFGNAGLPRTARGLGQLALSAGGAKNIEVTVEVRLKDGSVVDRVISRGAGENNVTQYHSMVFRSNNNPTWGELVKLEIPLELMEQCHVLLTFRARGSRDRGTISSAPEKPFAFAYFPLFLDTAAFVPDGSHTLILYRYDRSCATPQIYMQAPSTQDVGQTILLPASVAKALIPLRDKMVVRSFLVSTSYTQNETLLKVLNWNTKLLDAESLQDALTKLRFCSEVEICKFLRYAATKDTKTPSVTDILARRSAIFDALFGILISVRNQAGEVDDLVFQALVTILGTVQDRRFENFSPVLDVYISRHFTCSTASSHILKALHKLLRNPSSPEAGTTLRSAIKVWHYLFRFVVRSREIQRAKDVVGMTSDHLESTFKRELLGLLTQVNSLMRLTSPTSIIGTQTLAVQHFASIIPDLATCFNDQELSDILIAFGDTITLPAKGKMTVWKLLFMNQLVHSVMFASPDGRAALVPSIVRWIKPTIGKFDEHVMCSPKDTQTTRDSTRVRWIEGIRLAVGVIAAVLDTIHEALVDPKIRESRALLGQEQDNVEYLLGLLSPRLLDSYRELANTTNLDAVERERSQASVVSRSPVVFPSSYPFSLLSRSPKSTRLEQSVGGKRETQEWKERPSLQSGMGEIACVFVTLLLLAPRKIFVNWLEATLEVEGKDNFARLLVQIFKVSRSILENQAYPADWLNINILAHRVLVKIVEPVADILERDFIPQQQASFSFNTSLWRDFFGMLLTLLASPQLLIEEFSPQKRRAVWRLAGDLRGEGAKVFSRLWDAIGWPEDRSVPKGTNALRGRYGGYQVQFVPNLVEDILSLCLSHHDDLQSMAVSTLHSMIVSEYYLNDDFAVIEGRVIDRLDKLFMNQTKGDDLSRAFFIGQLRALFDEEAIDDRLRQQVDSFLGSVNSFLDLLLAVRNLPEGEEYQEDRIISTLKLMSFVKGLGRSEIYVRYVNRLTSFHVALGNETEAGLTLKLHADLHEWNLSSFAEAISDLDLPRQTDFARKETLYLRILQHLSNGKAWETALVICKELQHEYETTSFNYSRLSDLLQLQAQLYASIAKGDRHFGNYFRVAFYGRRFPLSVCGKQFVYRGNEFEKLGSFTEKMLHRHPGAQLLKMSTIPSDDIQLADGQFLQITAVSPEPDVESPVFNNPDIPLAVRAYYQHNETQTFSFTRQVSKNPAGRVRVTNAFTSNWTEKTVLLCESSFPTVLRRSEVVEIRILEISPLENALHAVDAKKKELDELERRYYNLGQTETRNKINTTVLAQALNSVVDPPADEGVPMFRLAFLGSDFMALNPEKAHIVRKLQDGIDDLVRTISRCLKLHAALCPSSMLPFHETLIRFYEKTFQEEILRLPNEPYDVTFPATAAPDLSFPHALPASTTQSGSSISISANGNPSLRYSTLDVAHSRRDSSATIVPASSFPFSHPDTRRDSVASSVPSGGSHALFHLPAITPLAGRTPSFVTGRSLDVLAENGSTEGPNGVGNSRGNGAPVLARSGSGSSERRGMLGSLGWRRRGESGLSGALAEE